MRVTRQQIIEFMTERGSVNLRDLVEHFGMAVTSAHSALKRLHDAKLTHIVKYKHAHGAPQPQFKAGPGEDKKKPRTLTTAQICRRYKTRLKVERPEEWQRQVEKQYVRRRKTPVFGDPVLAALMGFKKSRQVWVPAR